MELQNYPETKYVSKNATLQHIMDPFHVFEPLLTNITQNNWKEVDRFFVENPGSKNFINNYKILQLITDLKI